MLYNLLIFIYLNLFFFFFLSNVIIIVVILILIFFPNEYEFNLICEKKLNLNTL